jgi:hypothetical protein
MFGTKIGCTVAHTMCTGNMVVFLWESWRDVAVLEHVGSQPEWLQTIERNIGWMLVDAMEP